MTELDEFIPELALELIEEYGKAVDFEVTPIGVYDAGEDTNDTIPVPLQTKAIVEDFKLGQAVVNGLVEVGDKKLTVAALAFPSKPTSEDKAKFDGATYTVVSVITHMSGELPAIYELQVRRA